MKLFYLTVAAMLLTVVAQAQISEEDVEVSSQTEENNVTKEGSRESNNETDGAVDGTTTANNNNEDSSDTETSSIAETTTEPTDNNQNDTEATTTPSSQESSETTTTVSANCSEFTCAGVGRFPHPTDCQKYNYCWDLVHPYVTFTCKEKLVFDPRLGRCENDWSACSHLPRCVGDHQLLVDPNDETAYFVCKNIGSEIVPAFTVHKTYCAKHHKFNGELLVCVIDLEEIAAEINGSNDSKDEEKDKKKEKFVCTEEGIFPDLTDERNYYECYVKSPLKGTLKTKKRSCPKNYVFSLQDIICIPEIGQITA